MSRAGSGLLGSDWPCSQLIGVPVLGGGVGVAGVETELDEGLSDLDGAVEVSEWESMLR